MLYIIGLGLDKEGISSMGLEIVKRCKRVYLENYTVEFPYSNQEIVDVLGKKIVEADREKVEGLSLIDEAAKMEVALLVYGSPLFATTHITLMDEAKKSGVKVKLIYNASVFDALGETGLQLYKFGKISSMPAWDAEKNYEPDSFMEFVQHNLSMKAHSLVLVDIGLSFEDALEQMKKAAKRQKIKLDRFLVCSRMGNKRKKIIYGSLEELEGAGNIEAPFCFVIPSKMHFVEKEVVEGYYIG